MRMGYWMGLMLGCAITAGAQSVPYSFNYQGVLRGGSGELLPPGEKTVDFRLYTSANGTSAIWGRNYSILMETNGLFNVELSDGTGSLVSDPTATNALNTAIASSSALYLGMKVEGAAEIAPRQQLLSVPYALMAGNVKETLGNLTVKGSLQVKSGVTVTGVIQASDSIEVGKESTGVATLTAPNGTLNTTALNVKGNATVENNLTVIQDATVENNLTVTKNATVTGGLTVTKAATLNGATTLNGETTLNGSANLFSRSITPDTTWHDWSGTNLTLLSATDAKSDGFLMVNMFIKYDMNGDNENNHLDLYFNFSGVDTAVRSLVYGVHFYDVNGKTMSAHEIITLPVLHGETATISQTYFDFQSPYTVQYKKMFIPFGVNQ